MKSKMLFTMTSILAKPLLRFSNFPSAITEITVKSLFASIDFQQYLHHKNVTLPPSREGPFPSRFHPGSLIENTEDKIRDLLTERNPSNSNDWKDIQMEILSENDIITEENFSSVLMSCILELNSVVMANNFMKYLQDSGVSSNFLTHLKYMSLLSKHKASEDLILDIFSKVKPSIDRSPVLDHKRAELLLHGLCATKQWRLSFDYIKKLVPGKLSMDMRNHLAAAAVTNSDESLAWEILTKWNNDNEFPSNEALDAFVLHAIKFKSSQPSKSVELISRLFHYIEQKGYIINKDVLEHISQFFKDLDNWKTELSTVSRAGVCNACKKSLLLKELTQQEFQTLSNHFFERSVKKQDVFINTTNAEFNRYIKFVDDFKPFDVVIDGLNTAYTTTDIKTKRSLALHLYKVVDHLSKQSPRLLVLGRLHMKGWPSNILSNIYQKAHVFLTNNISQDDPFMIYAALSSGPHSLILSDDLMRDHIARLNEPRLIQLFKRWQQSHQMYLTEENGKYKIVEPLHHSISLQGNAEVGWHIPYDDKIELEPYEELDSWLCVKRTNK